MSLSTLFSILKGGSGSGNFGHTGNPPSRGGSKAGSGGATGKGLRQLANSMGLRIVKLPESQIGNEGAQYAIRDLKKQGFSTNMRVRNAKGIRTVLDDHKKFIDGREQSRKRAIEESSRELKRYDDLKTAKYGSTSDYVLNRSKTQRKKDIEYLATQPLKTLRRNQEVLEAQMREVTKRATEADKKKPNKVLSALQQAYDDQTQAIMKREFPND